MAFSANAFLDLKRTGNATAESTKELDIKAKFATAAE